jgi:7-keto-8-aminopelargonate synthetase-like enzyme
MRKNGFKVYGSDDCPICPVFVRDAFYTRYFDSELMKKGYYTIGLAAPAVPFNGARLRIIITYLHTDEQIDGLIQAFKEVAEACTFFEDMKDGTNVHHVHGGNVKPSLVMKSKL